MNPWYRAENWLAGVKNVAAFATFGAYARVAACSGKRNDEMPRFGMMPVAQRIGIEVRSWNRLLDAVHDDDLAAMLDGAQRVSHPRGEILSQQGKTIEKVYFPVTAVLSLVTTLADGSTIEMSTIGNEGTTGTTIYLGADSISNATCLCQIPGDSLCVDARTFRAAAGESERLRSVMNRYVLALLIQVGQAVACNALHSTLERAARWLLTSHDRVRADEFTLTQEFLSYMLGVRRASVTVAARTLQAAELIRYQHGKITIVDRAGLEEAACECYFVMRSALEEAVGPA